MRTPSSDADPLEDALSALVRAAQEDLDGASRMETPESADRGELVERAEFISFLLMAPGYCAKDFRTWVAGDELRVEAPDFGVTRALGCSVEASEVRSEYRNGVLSVTIPKRV